jgi:hypothetical protein
VKVLNDEQFNALEWAELTDLQELTGAKIEDIEPIGDGAASCCGVVLYLRRMDGSRAAVSINTPEKIGDSLYIDIAPIKTGGNFLEDMIKAVWEEIESYERNSSM